MERKELIPVELEDGTIIKIEVAQLGGEENVRSTIFDFKQVSQTIQSVGKSMYDIISSIKPDKASIEFGIEVGVEAGKLIALLVDGSSKASMKIKLEWSGKSSKSD